MDINHEHTLPQSALTRAGATDQRKRQFAKPSCIAGRISVLQLELGAAAACAWSAANLVAAKHG